MEDNLMENMQKLACFCVFWLLIVFFSLFHN